MLSSPVRTLPALLAIALLLSACAGSTDARSSGGTFTEGDVSFLQGMVPHHAQAVQMARLVPDRTAHPDELGELADTIIATQEDEISVMNDLLADAGEDPVEPSGTEGMDMSMEMSGMMSAEAMAGLAESDGDTFDGLFLEMMVDHHEGAIESAQETLDAGDGNADVTALAEDIIAAQEAEITQMRAWQEDWMV